VGEDDEERGEGGEQEYPVIYLSDSIFPYFLNLEG